MESFFQTICFYFIRCVFFLSISYPPPPRPPSSGKRKYRMSCPLSFH